MSPSKFPLLAIGIACSLSGCTTVPSLPEATGGIPVSEIVLRTKCELAGAFWTDDRVPRWLPGMPRFAWLRTWTSQVDLTLQVVDSATFSPGASIMQPLKNGYGVAAGASTLGGSTISAISQSFAVAAGVNYNGQAMRTEQLIFNFSVEELKRWYERPAFQDQCRVTNDYDLSGRLGLREWVQAALSPVALESEGDAGLLYAGYHPKPLASPAPPKQSPPAIPKPKALDTKATALLRPPKTDNCEIDLSKVTAAAQKVLDTLDPAVRAANKTLDGLNSQKTALTAVDANIRELRASLRQHEGPYGSVLEPHVAAGYARDLSTLNRLTAVAAAISGNISHGEQTARVVTDNNATKQALEAKALAANGTGQPPKCENAERARQKLESAQAVLGKTSLSDLQDLAKQAETDLKLAEGNLSIARNTLTSATATIKALPPIDPPIASFGQSVQFLLDMGANATPTWTFVRFKGPNSPLASVDSTRTHILLIAIGPSSGKDGSGGLEQGPKQAANNLLLTTLLPYGLGLGR